MECAEVQIPVAMEFINLLLENIPQCTLLLPPFSAGSLQLQ